jgi:hypothetical protein
MRARPQAEPSAEVVVRAAGGDREAFADLYGA